MYCEKQGTETAKQKPIVTLYMEQSQEDRENKNESESKEGGSTVEESSNNSHTKSQVMESGEESYASEQKKSKCWYAHNIWL